MLKFVPEIMMVAPTAPLVGLKLVIVGVGRTLKLDPLVIVTPLVVTVIGPSLAPAGTEVVMLVALEDVTDAVAPLNLTIGVGDVLKFVPEIVTVAPTAPLFGVKLVMVGVANTVKLAELKIVMPLVVTEIFPVEVPEGTITVILKASEAVTVAETPLNNTMGDGLKLFPLIVMVAPVAPLVGVKPDMLGVGSTEKVDPLLMVIPLTVIDIGPELAPVGTLVAILDVVEEDTEAGVPLNDTTGVVRKFVPEIFTGVPTAPLKGSKSISVGVASTVKFEPPVIVMPFTVSEIGPVNAFTGTVTFILLVVDEFTVAGIPLNETEGVVLKFVPVIVTMAPSEPLEGLNPIIVGVDRTTKLFVLRTVTPLTVTEIFPEVAPEGTVVVRLPVLEAVTTAVVLLNFTT